MSPKEIYDISKIPHNREIIDSTFKGFFREIKEFIQKGDISILTDVGIKRIKAPYNGITKPGTKRLIYMHEDTIWITVHATDKKDPESVLKDVIAKDFDDPDISVESMRKKLKLNN